MQKRCDDGSIIQVLIGQQTRHSNRVRVIGLARTTHLPLMHGKTEIISFGYEFGVCRRVISADQTDQVIGNDHAPISLTLALSFHQSTQQFFIVQIIFGWFVGLTTHQHSHGIFFRLVDFDLSLIAFNQAFK